MSKKGIVFFTDPHMGLNRARNTTPASMVKLRNSIRSQVENVLQNSDEYFMVCLGDWFDNYSNSETVLKESVPLLKQVDLVISGNHDQVNVKERVGSLELLSSFMDEFDCPYNDVGENHVFSFDLNDAGARLVVVPHCSTQELFDSALDTAVMHVREGSSNASLAWFLLLHCNYDNRFAEKDQNSLNLTKQQAARLLETFDYVMLGHEHQPREDFDGRLIVLGNTHPTGFADVSDKRIAVFENGKLEFRSIWCAQDGYREVDYREIADSYNEQFIRITGTAKASLLPEITKAAKAVQNNSPNLLALKLDVVYEDMPRVASKVEHGERKTLLEVVHAALEKEAPELLPLWEEFSA